MQSCPVAELVTPKLMLSNRTREDICKLKRAVLRCFTYQDAISDTTENRSRGNKNETDITEKKWQQHKPEY